MIEHKQAVRKALRAAKLALQPYRVLLGGCVFHEDCRCCRALAVIKATERWLQYDSEDNRDACYNLLDIGETIEFWGMLALTVKNSDASGNRCVHKSMEVIKDYLDAY
jgi:hypothetical protein